MKNERDTNAWVSEDRAAVWIGLALSAIVLVVVWVSH
jgi:hypothetical protein